MENVQEDAEVKNDFKLKDVVSEIFFLLQNGQLCSRIMPVLVLFHFQTSSCKNGGLIATGSRKTSAMKQQQLITV